MADENRGKYMMFSSEVSDVKALRKHLKDMDNVKTKTRKMRKSTVRQNVDKKTDNISVDNKTIEYCKKPKQMMHIYMPSIQ